MKGTVGSSHWVTFDADGTLSLVLEVGLDGSDPLNFEIHEGRFAPN